MSLSIINSRANIFHFESLIKGHKKFDRNIRNYIIKTVELNNNSTLAVIHPGYCREVIMNRIKYTGWPPIIYNTIKDNVADYKAYFKKLSTLITSMNEPLFVFCEEHKAEILERWVKSLSPNVPVVLVRTQNSSPRPTGGWDSFIKSSQGLSIKHFKAIGEMALKVNSKDEGCVSAFYNNIGNHLKIDILSEYTFPNLSFEILNSEIQRGNDDGAVLDPVSSKYVFFDD
jgi:hypothetical protein